jgi:hypothetical protein
MADWPAAPGPQGPAGPAGPSGQAAGKILYLASSDASDIAGYKTLLPSPSTGAEQTLVTACTGVNVDFLIATFATDPGVPGAVDFPAGTADRRIYAMVNSGTARFHLQVYKRDLAGVETLVRDEFSPNFTDQVVALQEWSTTAAAAGVLAATDRIVAKLYAQRITGGGGTVTVTTYYEGSSHASQVQTTISAGAQGPAGLPRVVQDEGSDLSVRSKLNFVGAGVAATDDSANDRTNVTIAGGGVPDNLSATTPDKVAWEYPAGTDVVELYGSRAAAAYADAQRDDFTSDTRANWVVLSSGGSSATWGGSTWSFTGGGFGYIAAPAAWGNAGDTDRVRILGRSNAGAFSCGFVQPGSLAYGSSVSAQLQQSGGLIKTFYDGGTSSAQTTNSTIAGITAGTYYVLELARNGNSYTVTVYDATGTTVLFTDTKTFTGSPATAYGAGVPLRPMLAMSSFAGSAEADWFALQILQGEQRDLLLAVTPSSGSRTAKRLFGSSGSSFRSDFAQLADLAPGSLLGTTYTPNTQTGTTYSPVLSDAGKQVELDNGSAVTLTVPPNSSVAFPVGTRIVLVRKGAGTVTIAPGSGVTFPNRIEAAGTSNRTISAQWGVATLSKRATDQWVLSGDIA